MLSSRSPPPPLPPLPPLQLSDRASVSTCARVRVHACLRMQLLRVLAKDVRTVGGQDVLGHVLGGVHRHTALPEARRLVSNALLVAVIMHVQLVIRQSSYLTTVHCCSS
jgi:hypothetical protein